MFNELSDYDATKHGKVIPPVATCSQSCIHLSEKRCTKLNRPVNPEHNRCYGFQQTSEMFISFQEALKKVI